MNSNDVDIIKKFNYHNYVPILNIKRFKYNIDNQKIYDNNKFIFNNDQILSSQDIPIIMENYLNEYNKQNQPSLFYSDKIYNRFEQDFKKIFLNQTLANPLDVNANSLKKGKIKNRRFSILSTKDWRVHFDSTTFELSFLYEWNMEYAGSTFYNNNNLKRIKSY